MANGVTFDTAISKKVAWGNISLNSKTVGSKSKTEAVFHQIRNHIYAHYLETYFKYLLNCLAFGLVVLHLRWLPTVTVPLNIDQSLKYQNDLAFRFLMLKNP